MNLLRHILMYLLFHFVLKSLIKRNYNVRCKSAISGAGKYPDKWYWADKIACGHGFFLLKE